LIFSPDTSTSEIFTLSLHDALPICYCLASGWEFINQRPIGVASINSAFVVGITKTNGCYLFNHCPAWRHAWRLGQYLARYSNGTCYRFGTGYFIFCGAHYLKANKQKIRVGIHISKILVPTPLALFTCSTKLPRTSAITFRS